MLLLYVAPCVFSARPGNLGREADCVLVSYTLWEAKQILSSLQDAGFKNCFIYLLGHQKVTVSILRHTSVTKQLMNRKCISIGSKTKSPRITQN